MQTPWGQGLLTLVLVAQSCPILCNPMEYSSMLLCPRNFPGKNTGVGCHFLLQGIFPTQRSNLGLHPCRQILNQLCCPGSPHKPKIMPSTQGIKKYYCMLIKMGPFSIPILFDSYKLLLYKSEVQGLWILLASELFRRLDVVPRAVTSARGQKQWQSVLSHSLLFSLHTGHVCTQM